jgi:hypothetical protein
MAELPKVQAANVQRAALADVPSLRFEDLAVAARSGGNIGDALDRMSQSLFKAQEEDVRRKAAEYAIERPLTPEQWRDIRREPKELEKYFKGQGKVFKETYMAAQASQLSSELTVRLENQFDLLKKKLELGEIKEGEAVKAVRDAIDGSVPVVASMSPEVGLKFKANVAMRGSSVYEKAVQLTARRTKTTDEIVMKQYTDNIPTQIDARIADLIGAGIPVDMRDVEALVLQEPARFAAKHGDENTFFAPAKKAFRAAVTAKIKDAVNSPAALDNPQVVQKALERGEFNITVNVAGKQIPIDLQAEWDYLNDEEKKSVREEFNASFNARYNLITKSREIDKLSSSRAVVEVAEGLKSKLLALDANDPGVSEAGISEFLAGKAKEFNSTASAVNSPEITKAASDGLMVVYKQFISDYVQTKMTPDQQKSLVLGQAATGDNSKSINYIFQSADLATKVELQKHLREEITARNSFLASEDRRVEDARKDAVREKIQIIFGKPRNSPEVKVALAELKTLDSLKWTDITKAFSAGRTQDDAGTIRQLQIARANGTLNTDMVLRLGSNLTINSQEQYFGYALTTSDKENEIALTTARNKLKYTRDIAAAVNKTASDIEAQNSYIAVETEFANRFLKNRQQIGAKDYKPWNAVQEMDTLLKDAVKEKEVKVVNGARSRVDSFRNTYLPKGKTYTDDEIRKQIQLSISGQKSDITIKLSPTDLNLYVNDLNALKGAK